MATRIAWLLNLDADSELAGLTPGGTARYRPDPDIQARIADLAPKMQLLLRPDDLIVEGPDERATGLTVLTFCPTPSALARLSDWGLSAALTADATLLRRLNSRAFCAELGQTLPHARYVHDMTELELAIRAPSATGSFLLKRAFSFAGRERRQARAGVLDASTRGFAARSFARGEGLQVEPWLERRGDFARHGFVRADGHVLFGPLVQQHNSAAGRWQRSELAGPDVLTAAEQASLERELSLTASALVAEGYRGPFGVDAFRYLDGHGDLAFQPRCEINVRFTMGYPRTLLDQGLS
jgi:hypothetical protein